MNKISLEEINRLLRSDHSSPAITIYLPTHKTASSPHMTENQTRFKNLFSKALKELSERDKHVKFNQEFEDQCRQLLADKSFWLSMSESLLICARPSLFEYYHLPIDSDEHVSVGEDFHLAPVLGLVKDMRNYHVLSIAQHDPILFKGDFYELQPTQLQLPKSIEEALNIDEMHIKSIQFASVKSSKGAQYHGHGAGKDTGDEERLRFFKIIDEKVFKSVDKDTPVILAGIHSEIAEYRTISRLPNLTKNHIEGHFTAKDTTNLYSKAIELIRSEIVAEEHKLALERYQELHGQAPERTAERLSELKEAAATGRIGTLLIGMTRKTRDTVRDSMARVPKLVFPSSQSNGEIDSIARQVVRQSGEVINLFIDEMPGKKPVLAIHRY